MSGYNYNDQMGKGCGNGCTTTLYNTLEETVSGPCKPSCICRNNKERSSKDKMDYNFYVKGQPMNLKPFQNNAGWKKHTYSDAGLQ